VAETDLHEKVWMHSTYFPEFNWKQIQVIDNSHAYVFGTSLDPNQPVTGRLIYKLIYTSDSGKNWKMAFKGDSIFEKGGWNSMHFYDKQGGFMVGDGTLFHTTNQGNSWTQILLDSATRFTRIIQAEQNVFFGYGRQGLYKSTNFGNTWVKQLGVQQVYSISKVGNLIYMAADGGLYRGATSNSWQLISNPELSIVNMHFRNPSFGVCLSSHDNGVGNYPSIKVWSTQNGGLTWDYCSPIQSGLIPFQNSSVFYDQDGTIYLTGANGIVSSQDHGLTWIWQLNEPAIGNIWVTSLRRCNDKLFATTEHQGRIYFKTK
jgi:photosystem II stability/assembly factor-like uncharacterized protein